MNFSASLMAETREEGVKEEEVTGGGEIIIEEEETREGEGADGVLGEGDDALVEN